MSAIRATGAFHPFLVTVQDRLQTSKHVKRSTRLCADDREAVEDFQLTALCE
jgi:hypothetical protein